MSAKDLWPLFAFGFGMMIVAVVANMRYQEKRLLTDDLQLYRLPVTIGALL